MAIEKLPLFVCLYPAGQARLTCAHCAVDAELEGARVTALYTDRDGEVASVLWQSDLTPEDLFRAAPHQCLHLRDLAPLSATS